MKTNYKPDTADEIEKVVYDILKQSKAFDLFPTPVSDIVDYAELFVDKSVGLHNIPNHYISKKIDVLKSALSKIFGALDRRKKIIYLNPDSSNGKQNFVQLHEVGHDTLPWQRNVFDYVEDEKSLSIDVQEQFEAEANYFASGTLFQLNRFERDISSLPLEIASVRHLASKYGASIQATFRRYVEKLHKRAALLVLVKPVSFGQPLTLRNFFTSEKFSADFQNMEIPDRFSIEWPFIRDFYSNRKWIDQPRPLSLNIEDNVVDFVYRYFFNGHNVFILITPPKEKISSRTTVQLINS
jgi:Zn-dependent peptidase ImmA (M78 family)